MFDQQQKLLGRIEQKLEKKANRGELKQLNRKYLNLINNHFQERESNLQKLQKFLTSGQFAKFLLFERRFGKNLKKRIEQMRERHKN